GTIPQTGAGRPAGKTGAGQTRTACSTTSVATCRGSGRAAAVAAAGAGPDASAASAAGRSGATDAALEPGCAAGGGAEAADGRQRRGRGAREGTAVDGPTRSQTRSGGRAGRNRGTARGADERVAGRMDRHVVGAKVVRHSADAGGDRRAQGAHPQVLGHA